MKLAIVLFLLALLAGMALGVFHDLASSQRARVAGTVVAHDPGGQAYKSPIVKANKISVRLESGTVVEAAAASQHTPAVGSRVVLGEMAAPWGTVWYKLLEQN